MTHAIDLDKDVFIMKKALYPSNGRSKIAAKYKNWIGSRYMFHSLIVGHSVFLLNADAFDHDVVTSPLEGYLFDDKGLLHLFTENTEYIFEKETT